MLHSNLGVDRPRGGLLREAALGELEPQGMRAGAEDEVVLSLEEERGVVEQLWDLPRAPEQKEQLGQA